MQLYIPVFFISLAILSAEMVIIRVMSIVNSSSFASMVISIALLGFGISGTIITVLRRRIESNIDRILYVSAVAAMFFTSITLPLAGLVEFVPQSLHEDYTQIIRIGAFYLIFFLPFFAGSFFINLSFIKAKTGIGKLYFFNLTGSGIGALAILLLMTVIDPSRLMLPVVFFAMVPVLLTMPRTAKGVAVSAAAILISLVPFFTSSDLKISQYKDISYAMKYPDVKIIATKPSPTGYIEAVESSMLRFAPGLALSSYDVITPNQVGLYIDGSSASGIATPLTGENARYINYLPFALPFSVKQSPSVLILGAGGGNPVLFAEHLGSSKITAVEPDMPLMELIRTKFNDAWKGVWEDPRVRIVNSDGRSFCSADNGKYDIITIPAMMSSGMSFSSGSGHGENYLFTKEAFVKYMERLNDGGLLNITMTMESPPCALLKLEALSFSYLKERYPKDYMQRIIFMRGMDWGMVLLKNGVFTQAEIAAVKKFNNTLSADFSWYPGIKESELNVYNLIDDELYYKLAKAYNDNQEKDFIASYAFVIEPPVDNKPFFRHNLRVSEISRLFTTNEELETLPFSEWGYLVMWATLLQGIIFGVIVILIPVFAPGVRFLHEKGKTTVITYFSMLGLGFMLVEMSVIQKLTLVIANPLYSVAVVISSLLIFSGLGARVSGRFRENPVKGITVAAAGTILGMLFNVALFAFFTDSFLSLPAAVRMVIAVLSLAPVGFFMGMPFPLGLQVLGDRKDAFMPWALAVNGSVSVFAAVLTNILSMHLGFWVVAVIAICCYSLALVSFPGRWIHAE